VSRSPRGIPQDDTQAAPDSSARPGGSTGGVGGERRASVVVIGDVILDRDVVGSSDRVSPDMGAPVLDVAAVSQTPGGAGLTALLCVTPSTRVTLVAPVATDPPGRALAAALRRRVRLIPLGHEGGTRVKARLFARDRAMLRLDTGGPGTRTTLKSGISGIVRAVLADADIVLVSDYGAGMTRDPMIRALLTEITGETMVVWDPHPRGGAVVPGVSVVTPNLAEARGVARCLSPVLVEPGRNETSALGSLLREHWSVDAVCLTTGADGVTVVTGSGATDVRPPATEVGDPCGAGDRFAASLALELLAGADVVTAARHAVDDAAAWVGGVGAGFRHSYGDDGPVDLGGPDLTAAGTRAMGTSSVAQVAADVRARGGTLVATGGVFDVLHAGHVGYLGAARALGDALVVLVNSDASVRRRKGPGRPVNGVADRCAVLSALAAVDAVAVFEQDDPRTALAQLRPDLWVKGGDYDVESMPETPDVRAWGGQVLALPLLAGRSSTRTLQRLTQPACAPEG